MSIRAAVLAAVLALVLTACGGDDPTGPTGSADAFSVQFVAAPDTARLGERTGGFTVEVVRVVGGDSVPVEGVILRLSSERGCATPFGSFLETTEEGHIFPEFTPQETGACAVAAEYIRQDPPRGVNRGTARFEVVD